MTAMAIQEVEVNKQWQRNEQTVRVTSVAVKERLIPRNPTDDRIAPKVQKVEMKTLLLEHLKAYPDSANARDVLPTFYLELVSGLRKGELVALLWSDPDADQKTISVSKQYVRNLSGEVTLSRPKTETSVRQVSIPQVAVDLLIQEHSKHPDNPYMFPSPVVLSGFRGKAPREDSEGCRTGTYPLPRPQTNLRNHGPPERSGRENRQQYAGPLRRRIHAQNLHSCHPADAESGSGDHGKFYGKSPVTSTDGEKQPDRKAYLPVWRFLSLSGHF